MFSTWGISPFAQTRDSDALARSNWAVISKDLTDRFGDDVEVISCSHWACGWIEHLTVRVIDEHGLPTEAFLAVCEWKDTLNDYPVANDDHFSELEMEETIETIANCYQNLVRDENLPDDWAAVIYGALEIRSPDELTEELVREAAITCGLSPDAIACPSCAHEAHPDQLVLVDVPEMPCPSCFGSRFIAAPEDE
jgi:hypothetical protein